MAEYGVLLQKCGAVAEAISVLHKIDPTIVPESLLYQSFCHFNNWDYLAAQPLLEKYLSLTENLYSRLVCQVDGFDSINSVVRDFDFESIYQNTLSKLNEYGLNGNCKILRFKSEDAISLIPNCSVQLLHIDGNHSTKAVQKDVELYLPKMAHGGFIWFDDASRPSIQPAIQYVAERCSFYEQLSHDDIIFRRPLEQQAL